MKHLPLYLIFSSSKTIFSLIPVGFISEYRAAYRRHMDTDLMHTSSFERYFQETIFIANICINYTIVCYGFLSSIIDSYFRFILGILYSKQFHPDCITSFQRLSYHESMIYFFYFPSLEKDEEGFKSRFIFCNHDSTTRISIDSVYERRTKRESIIFSREIILYQFYKRYFLCFMISWMYIETRTFIDHEKEIIFIQDGRRDFLIEGMIMSERFFFLKSENFFIM